jgi:hypothetical protein
MDGGTRARAVIHYASMVFGVFFKFFFLRLEERARESIQMEDAMPYPPLLFDQSDRSSRD